MPVGDQLLDHAPPKVRNRDGLLQRSLLAVTIVRGATHERRTHFISGSPEEVVLASLAAVEDAHVRPELNVPARDEVLEGTLVNIALCSIVRCRAVAREQRVHLPQHGRAHDRVREALRELAANRARVDDGETIFHLHHRAVVVRIRAIARLLGHPPQKKHELLVATKRHRVLLYGDAVEADVVTVALEVGAQRGRVVAHLVRRRVQQRDRLLSELVDLVLGELKQLGLKRRVALDRARLACLDEAWVHVARLYLRTDRVGAPILHSTAAQRSTARHGTM
mmetsp:Transcript_15024/g.48329  ORF Transcript_15024/g.48329 Transcript_15024/m.48329 type:complete len:280 (+) Transcript_15024:2507-3346(+)